MMDRRMGRQKPSGDARGRFLSTVLQIEHTGNWAANTNKGLAVAKGRFSCFLHQDDLWEPGRLQNILEALRQLKNTGWVTTESWFIDAVRNRRGRWRSPFSSSVRPNDTTRCFEALLVQNSLAICSPAFDTSMARIVGGLNENAIYTADWEFWLQMAASNHECEFMSRRRPFPSGFHPNAQTIALALQSRAIQAGTGGHSGKRFASLGPERVRCGAANSRNCEILDQRECFPWRDFAATSETLWMFAGLLRSAFRMGPKGFFDYLRMSRVLDRVAGAKPDGKINSWNLISRNAGRRRQGQPQESGLKGFR
jgi:hypothetical protein